LCSVQQVHSFRSTRSYNSRRPTHFARLPLP